MFLKCLNYDQHKWINISIIIIIDNEFSILYNKTVLVYYDHHGRGTTVENHCRR